MAEKKKSNTPKKKNIEKAPPLRERITDFSVSAGKVTWVPKQTRKK